MTTTTRRHNRATAKTGRDLLFWLAIIVGLIGCFWNMQPYIKVATTTLATVLSVSPDLPVDPALVQTPLTIWDAISARAIGIGGAITGFFLWAFLQILELYPVFLRHDGKVLRQLAEQGQQSDRMVENDADPADLVKIKRWYNSLPYVGFRTATRGALVAYGVDAVICLTQYPPVEGGFGNLFFALVTGQLNLINWSNVALIVVMMFLCEIILRIVLYCHYQAQIVRDAYRYQ